MNTQTNNCLFFNKEIVARIDKAIQDIQIPLPKSYEAYQKIIDKEIATENAILREGVLEMLIDKADEVKETEKLIEEIQRLSSLNNQLQKQLQATQSQVKVLNQTIKTIRMLRNSK